MKEYLYRKLHLCPAQGPLPNPQCVTGWDKHGFFSGVTNSRIVPGERNLSPSNSHCTNGCCNAQRGDTMALKSHGLVCSLI